MSQVFSYNCIGLISGSSLDGLDVLMIRLTVNPTLANPIVDFGFVKSSTYEFEPELVDRLRNLPHQSALDLVKLDDELGVFFGETVKSFIQADDEIDFISSHGHTIFHHPGKSSTQIGNPAIIAATTGIRTIGHLRNMDTAYGGQGAPLAPMAGLYLLPDHDICVNLGGIANVSIKSDDGIIGFDVCGANQFLNHLAQQLGPDYDDGGAIARKGNLDSGLLDALNGIPYCQLPAPKSLDNEEVRSYYLPILDQSDLSISDQLATMVEHIAMQLTNHFSANGTVHLAGGGARNTYLVERIKHFSNKTEVVVGTDAFIDFKEAALIAMCGALRLHELPNSLKSITGAAKDTVNGVIFHP